MYQQVLRRFAHFNAIQISEPAPLKELIVLALKEEEDPKCSVNHELNEKIAEVMHLLSSFFGLSLCMSLMMKYRNLPS